LCPC